MPTDLASTETQKESVSLLFLDQDLGSTDTQKESQFLLKKEKVDEESNIVKLSAKLCNELFSRLDLEQYNIQDFQTYQINWPNQLAKLIKDKSAGHK